MKKFFILAGALYFLLEITCFSYGQDDKAPKQLLLRQAMQVEQNIVAVEAYCIGDILEVKVRVRMYSERPKITNVLIVGPKLGRLSYKRKKDLPLDFKDEEPYPAVKKGGFISFGKKQKIKQPEGTLTQELFKFEVPWKKIVLNKHYQLWVDIESKTRGGRRPMKFKFDLDKIHDVIPTNSN